MSRRVRCLSSSPKETISARREVSCLLCLLLPKDLHRQLGVGLHERLLLLKGYLVAGTKQVADQLSDMFIYTKAGR